MCGEGGESCLLHCSLTVNHHSLDFKDFFWLAVLRIMPAPSSRLLMGKAELPHLSCSFFYSPVSPYSSSRCSPCSSFGSACLARGWSRGLPWPLQTVVKQNRETTHRATCRRRADTDCDTGWWIGTVGRVKSCPLQSESWVIGTIPI